jgi:hypothetical protein
MYISGLYLQLIATGNHHRDRNDAKPERSTHPKSLSAKSFWFLISSLWIFCVTVHSSIQTMAPFTIKPLPTLPMSIVRAGCNCAKDFHTPSAALCRTD